MADIKPCPFCGGPGVLSFPERDYASWAVVYCSLCGIRGKAIPFHTFYNCEGSIERQVYGEQAEAVWNKRYVQPTQPKQETPGGQE